MGSTADVIVEGRLQLVCCCSVVDETGGGGWIWRGGGK